MDPKNFCNFCCEFESGVVTIDKEEACKEKCGNALKNIISPVVSVSLNLNKGVRKNQG